MQEYILDTERLLTAIQLRGFKSLSDLSRHLGFHRNTLGHFAKGEGVFPKSLQTLFHFLGVDGRRFIHLREHATAEDTVAMIVDALVSARPRCCVVLFGSRARGSHRAYSDFDLGIFSKEELSHDHYLNLIEIVDQMSEDFAYRVQLVNLCRAERVFLKQIALDMKFIGGRMSDWVALKERVNEGREIGESVEQPEASSRREGTRRRKSDK